MSFLSGQRIRKWQPCALIVNVKKNFGLVVTNPLESCTSAYIKEQLSQAPDKKVSNFFAQLA